MCRKTLTNCRKKSSQFHLYLTGRRTLNGSFMRTSKNLRYENPCTIVIGHIVDIKQGKRQHLKLYGKLEEMERGKLENIQKNWNLITKSLVKKNNHH